MLSVKCHIVSSGFFKLNAKAEWELTLRIKQLEVQLKQVPRMAEAGVGLKSFLCISEEEQCGHTELQSMKLSDKYRHKKKTQHLKFQTVFMHETILLSSETKSQ